MHLTRPGSSILAWTALASELDRGMAEPWPVGKQDVLGEAFRKGHGETGECLKKNLGSLLKFFDSIFKPANVRTAIFRVKPDSHFLDGATEIDAPRPGDKQNVWEDSQVYSQTSPAVLRDTSVFVLQ